jgi:predicted DNA binding protein
MRTNGEIIRLRFLDSSIHTKGESLLSKQTTRQRQLRLTAYTLGYYDVTRRISSDELSRRLGLDKPTIVEHRGRLKESLLVAF